MLIRNRMTHNPMTVTPQDTLATAQEKMTAGRFRHLPVVQDGTLIGILTDRDVRRHVGVQERTRVVAAMTEGPLTVSPLATVEEAAQLLLTHQIDGLPVLEDGKLVGILTTSDVMHALLDVRGATTEGSVRIDLVQREEGPDLSEAAKLVSDLGGQVLGIGTYVDRWGPVFSLRLHGVDPQTTAVALGDKGFTVLGVHQ